MNGRKPFFGQHESKVVFARVVFDWTEKPPYERSGRSIWAGFETTPDESKIKCHECGETHSALWRHVKRRHHDLGIRGYKRKHGLNLGTGLVSPSLGAKISFRARSSEKILVALEKGRSTIAAMRATTGIRNFNPARSTGPRSEANNLNRNCAPQLVARIQKIAADLGKTPTWADLISRDGLHVATVLNRLEVKSIEEIMTICGLEPTESQKNGCGGNTLFADTVLIELLRDAHVQLRRVPCAKDCKAPLLPSPSTFIKHFGTWMKALDAAGLGLMAREQTTANRRAGLKVANEARRLSSTAVG